MRFLTAIAVNQSWPGLAKEVDWWQAQQNHRVKVMYLLNLRYLGKEFNYVGKISIQRKFTFENYNSTANKIIKNLKSFKLMKKLIYSLILVAISFLPLPRAPKKKTSN
ncbi:MAG: hypothetical protein U5K54_13070 [Cytophagales bacterium]|nr:hypothetical protein [Cytophagales bacterium]